MLETKVFHTRIQNLFKFGRDDCGFIFGSILFCGYIYSGALWSWSGLEETHQYNITLSIKLLKVSGLLKTPSEILEETNYNQALINVWMTFNEMAL